MISILQARYSSPGLTMLPNFLKKVQPYTGTILYCPVSQLRRAYSKLRVGDLALFETPIHPLCGSPALRRRRLAFLAVSEISFPSSDVIRYHTLLGGTAYLEPSTAVDLLFNFQNVHSWYYRNHISCSHPHAELRRTFATRFRCCVFFPNVSLCPENHRYYCF